MSSISLLFDYRLSFAAPRRNLALQTCISPREVFESAEIFATYPIPVPAVDAAISSATVGGGGAPHHGLTYYNFVFIVKPFSIEPDNCSLRSIFVVVSYQRLTIALTSVSIGANYNFRLSSFFTNLD